MVIVAAEAVSQQVVVKEDFAFVVPASVTAGALVAVVREAGGDLVEDARVFDVYEGAQVEAGHKSMAVNVRMRAADHTLSADEVLGVRETVIAAAQGQLGAVLRQKGHRMRPQHLDAAVGSREDEVKPILEFQES